MKTKTSMTTISKATVEVITKPKEAARVLSLDEIEEQMTQIALDDTTDFVKMMLNEKKLAMLEKVANIKMHRLQLKALEQSNEPVDVTPIEVKFISSKTQTEQERIARIDSEVRESRGIKEDA